MFKIVLIMFMGILSGYILKQKSIPYINSLIMILICLLLLFLGIEVGMNEEILNNFSKIGSDAIIISLAAVAGSVLLSFLLWKFVNKDK